MMSNNLKTNKKELIEPIEFFNDNRDMENETAVAGMTAFPTPFQEQKITGHLTGEIKYLFTATENNEAACANMIYQILGGNFIYVSKCYYMWSGYIWARISKEMFKCHIVSILDARLKYVQTLPSYDGLSYVDGCCNNGRINSIIAILQTFIAVEPYRLNNDAGLLCVRNGVINFSDRTILPHYAYKERYMTAMIDIDYISGFRHPVFDNFIYSIMDYDNAKINYIQSALGYAIIGNPCEQMCFILKGSGANGKTTLIDAVNAVLTNHYCCTVPKNIIMREENRDINASSSMLASLNGKRIAFTSELRKKDRIAEAPFKKLIGGGKITAREVYKPVEEFDMTATLMIDSNYLPSIESADDVEAYAIKRRMTIIPFNHRFGPEDRDVTLPRKLRDYQVQEAILAWMIDGAWAYLDFGLRPTPEMQYALETYMLLENSVIGFFHNCIIDTDNPDDFVSTKDLYEAYINYCKLNNLQAVTSQKFAKCDTLKTKCKADRADMRGYCGIALIC